MAPAQEAIIRWYTSGAATASRLLGRPQLQLCGPVHQVGQGCSPHLCHHPPAMDLDSDLADAELRSGLFVQPSRDHQLQNLLLAWGQRRITVPQLSELALLASGDTITLNRHLNAVQQILVEERFGEELDGSRLHGTD